MDDPKIVVEKFIAAMCEWEKGNVELHRLRKAKQIDENEFRSRAWRGLHAIFIAYADPAKTAEFEMAHNYGYQSPLEYDPATQPINEVKIGKVRATVRTHETNGFERTLIYHLRLINDRWFIMKRQVTSDGKAENLIL